jgi:hypothetical protein
MHLNFSFLDANVAKSEKLGKQKTSSHHSLTVKMFVDPDVCGLFCLSGSASFVTLIDFNLLFSQFIFSNLSVFVCASWSERQMMNIFGDRSSFVFRANVERAHNYLT